MMLRTLWVKALLQELPWLWIFVVQCWNRRWCAAVWSTWTRCNHACVVPHFQTGKWVSALIHPAVNICPKEQKPDWSWGTTRCVTRDSHTWISRLLWIVSYAAPIPLYSAQHNKQPRSALLPWWQCFADGHCLQGLSARAQPVLQLLLSILSHNAAL